MCSLHVLYQGENIQLDSLLLVHTHGVLSGKCDLEIRICVQSMLNSYWGITAPRHSQWEQQEIKGQIFIHVYVPEFT